MHTAEVVTREAAGQSHDRRFLAHDYAEPSQKPVERYRPAVRRGSINTPDLREMIENGEYD